MRMVVLFGGGDAGGIIITDQGVRPIPPFDPGVRLQLSAVSKLVHSLHYLPGEDASRKMAPSLQRLANFAVEQVEQIVGPLDQGRAVIYVDDDGGFSCGSTGQPPIPIPWPVAEMPQISDLVANGAFGADMVDFLHLAKTKGLPLIEAFEAPERVAGSLGIQLSAQTVHDLRLLAPSSVQQLQDPVEKEVAAYFHKVVEEGNHLHDWATRPFEVSRNLGVNLSDEALDRVIAGASSVSMLGPGAVMNPVAVAVAVGVVIMLVTRPGDRIKDRVRDRSGIAKF